MSCEKREMSNKKQVPSSVSLLITDLFQALPPHPHSDSPALDSFAGRAGQLVSTGSTI